MRNKKKNTLLAGLAFTMLVGAGSLAYFTDRVESTFTGKAGTVTLEQMDEIEGNQNMAPGDTVAVGINTKYTGSLDAKVRIVLTQDEDADELSKLVGKDAEQGFRLKDGETVLEFTGDKHIIDLGVKKTGETITSDLVLELLAKSDNRYQDKGVAFEYEVQALQDSHTNGDWTTLDNGAIEIVPA